MIIDKVFRLMHHLNYRLRRNSLLKRIGSFGKNFRLDPFSTFTEPELMSFGDDVFINKNAHFSGKITVGNDVLFGPNVTIFGHNHRYSQVGSTLTAMEADWVRKPVSISDHCWIGSNVVIAPGSDIATGVVIAAGSVVRCAQRPFTLYAGNPARPVKAIFTEDELANHLRLLNKDDEYISSVLEKSQKYTVKSIDNS